ncbi:phenylalanine--tRNA ligase subunit alpha, partial [Salmonella sp. 3DZ2-4SM]
MSLREKLSELRQDALVRINEAKAERSLQDVKVNYLGKKGVITGLMKEMKELPKEERPEFGQLVNEVRKAVEKEIEAKQVLLEEEALNQQLENETIDVTLPGRKVSLGAKHPLTKINEDLEDLFIGLGYEIVEGYEVESDYYNFEALNLPKSHPARDMQDTFYISEEILMRTHTSPVQARTLEKRNG